VTKKQESKKIVETKGGESSAQSPEQFAAAVGRALRRSARAARRIARMHGTPIYVMRDGKVVAEKP
jgi:hypothetical protein